MTPRADLMLHQLVDTQFPTGAFSQSFGFEYLTFSGAVTDPASFQNWLADYLTEQLTYCEGLVIREVHQAPAPALAQVIQTWSAALYAQMLPKEMRYGNIQMGKQFSKLINQLLVDPQLQQYQTLVQEKVILPHSAIVFCLACRALQLTCTETLTNYYYMTLYNLTQNAVRGIPIGQTKGQQLIVALHPVITQAVAQTLALSVDEFGRTAPGLEIAQMKHQFLYSRSFMS
ncbi:urease accessory protein UreF [Agrilactobacillus composti]|nr:urease accessory protein UreF [Agrilactobacillus composti]